LGDLEGRSRERKGRVSGGRERRREESRIDGRRGIGINEGSVVRSERGVEGNRIVSVVRHSEEVRILRNGRERSKVTVSWRKSRIVVSLFDWVRFGNDDSGRWRRRRKAMSTSVVLGEIPLCGEAEFDGRNRSLGKSGRRRNWIDSFDRLYRSEFHDVAKFFVRSEFVEFGELCDERRRSNERSSSWRSDRRIIELGRSRTRGRSLADLKNRRIVEYPASWSTFGGGSERRRTGRKGRSRERVSAAICQSSLARTSRG